jgi:riboflavin biosynthesis pyrimidine reductase
LRAEHGVRSILCEGGPHLNGSLLAAGLVDELFLTTSPTIAGGAGALTIIEGTSLTDPIALELIWLLAAGDELFARYALG